MPYILGKLLHGIISAFYTYIYLCLNSIEAAVFKMSVGKSFSVSAAYMAVVVIICLISAISIRLVHNEGQG